MRSVAGRSGCSGTRWSATRPTRRCRRLSVAGWSARWRIVSMSGRTGGWSGSRAGRWIEWIRAYRQGGFEALVPRPRVVAPRTPAEMLELAFALKRERPERTAAQVQEIMLASAGEGTGAGVADVADASRPAGAERPRGRPLAGQGLWPLRSVGAQRAVDGGRVARPQARRRGARRAVLLAFIDDHSRLLVGWRWGTGEDVFRLEAALRSGLMSRGVPERDPG